MMLGDVLREARQAAAVLDSELRGRIEAAGEAPGVFAREAVVHFERHASEEDWATMMSAIRSAPDPGKACLDIMVRWRLQRALQNGIADKRGTP
jgi:hypothetical protein